MEIFNRLKKYDLWWAGPLIMVLMYFMEEIFTWIDPTSHIIHPEIWQYVFYTWAISVILSNASFAFMAINFPNLYAWYSSTFEKNSDLTSSQRAWLFSALFLGVLLSSVMILVALVS